MKKARKQKIEKIITAIIYSLIIIFFAIELFAKPTTGEDVYQAQCVANSAINDNYGECVSDSLASIPRFGQLIHTMIISTFYSMPSFGPETLYRLVDAIMCCAIVYMITYLAHGQRPKLEYRDALTAALVTVALLFSNVAQIFFSGFASIHNYVLGVLFTLIFIYQWFYKDKIIAKANHPGLYYALFIVCGFIFGAALEPNSVIFLIILVAGIVIAKIRKKSFKNIGHYLFDHISSLVGVLAGFVFVYIIGGGAHAIINRSGLYQSSHKINELWHSPSTAIPEFFHNTVVNFSSFLPYIFIAVVALVMIYRSKKSDLRNHVFATAIVYAVLYIAACFSFDSAKWYITASAFCALLVPAAYLMSEVVTQIKRKPQVVCSIIAILLLISFNIDSILYHTKANAATADVLERTVQLKCLDRSYIRKNEIPSSSPIFGFQYHEDAFMNVDQNWYGSIYLIDGYDHYLIVDSCYLPGEKENK
ncbi:hypothetical protein J5500_03250 [Candidatus Saccharibacteria bacterium]|nr:hypothetical protein [Candidatus Saccharibacteria bacterium]